MQAAQSFGQWAHDELGLPCFDLVIDETRCPYDPLRHLIGSGRMWGFCNRWGNLELSTSSAEAFQVEITKNRHQCRSAVLPHLVLDGQVLAVTPSEWHERQPIRYGLGYARYRGCHQIGGSRWEFDLTIAAGEDLPCCCVTWRIRNADSQPRSGQVLMAADCSLVDRYHAAQAPRSFAPGQAAFVQAHPLLGDFVIRGQGMGTGPSPFAVGIETPFSLAPGEEACFEYAVGYGADSDAWLRYSVADLRAWWKAEVAAARALHAPETWMRDEAVWTLGQFLSFTGPDQVMGGHYISLGGYGWTGFNVREIGENALGLAALHPKRCAELLHFLIRRSWPNGGHHPGYGSLQPPPQPEPPQPKSSDTELWFLLAVSMLGEAPALSLDAVIANSTGEKLSVWAHALRSWDYVLTILGRGRHGLLHNGLGDWNDYLFPMGKEGRGESVMNTGMACCAGARLASLARVRGDHDNARRIASDVAAMRSALSSTFTGTHFLRGYTDAGRPVGETQVFVDAQSWVVLGGAGTQEQRITALRHTLRNNDTPLGLCLVAPPFSSPPPPDISSLPIPPGEGENGGVWPQTVAWMVWALAESGLRREALDLWVRMTLRHHYATYPETPFGIWNGPDCYNSHVAGDRANWTQTQIWDRRAYAPMNPSVAWQAFALQRIAQAEESPDA